MKKNAAAPDVGKKDGLDLRTLVAKAMWETGSDGPPVPWRKLDAAGQDEWKEWADAALEVVLHQVARPEYDRWKDSDEIGAVGACANIMARLMGVQSEDMASKSNTQCSSER